MSYKGQYGRPSLRPVFSVAITQAIASVQIADTCALPRQVPMFACVTRRSNIRELKIRPTQGAQTIKVAPIPTPPLS